jgi:hypothetical protein
MAGCSVVMKDEIAVEWWVACLAGKWVAHSAAHSADSLVGLKAHSSEDQMAANSADPKAGWSVVSSVDCLADRSVETMVVHWGWPTAGSKAEQ